MKQLQLTSAEYQALDALSNSELKLIDASPSDFIWGKQAPRDTTKSTALDFGTALHTALIEPNLFSGSVIIYDQTKSRDTVKFTEFQKLHDDNAIILLESEYDKIRLMVDSCKAHPTFNKYLELCTEREKSIVGDFMGVPVKIRPDLKCDVHGILCDLKTSADISAWRESAKWKNPLYTFDYGHSCAMYMDVYQEYLGKPVNEYQFLVAQKSINCGRYPVGVFTITREELNRYGFFDRFYNNLDKYKACIKSGDWTYSESFPLFKVEDYETMDITYDE